MKARRQVRIEVARWIQRDTDQSAFPLRIDGQRDEGRRQQMTGVIDDAQAAPLFGDEDASIGRQFHGRGSGQAGAERRLAETRRQDCRREPIFQAFDAESARR